MAEGKDTVSKDWKSFLKLAKNIPHFQKKLVLTGFSSFVFIIVVVSAAQYLPSAKSPKTLIKGQGVSNLFDTDFLHTPEIITKLKTDKNNKASLKARFSLEVASKDEKERVNQKMHLIASNLQKRLSAYSARDLRKKSGIEKVRRELLDKINTITKPVQINQIFIKDFLIN